jgi:Bacterial lipid A biosynthesis acyltransferase
MTFRDVLHLGKLLPLALIAWLLPPRFWRRVASATGRIGQRDRCWPVYEDILAHKYSRSEIADISVRRRSFTREMKLQIFGLNGPWRSWRPDVRLNGEAHLRGALASGHGTILWVVETAFSTLVVKMALYNRGLPPCQLSRPGHGFSNSSFGIRFLNPIWTGVEDRFIAERILIASEYATDALATLRARLAENRIVNITFVPQAHKFAEVPFFHGQLQLPTGPIRLALATGAALLPVFAFATDNGGFEVSIEEPLYPGSEPASVENIAAAFAKRLEPFVLEHPDQWNGWDWLAGRLRHSQSLPAAAVSSAARQSVLSGG